MSEAGHDAEARELFFRLSEDKLRGRTLWVGAALCLSLLMPYEIIEDQPQFLWQLFGELPPSGIVAALAYTLAGLTIVALGRLTLPSGTLALAVLTALVAAFVVRRAGSDASTWGTLPLPESVVSGSALALLSLSCVGGASSLSGDDRMRAARRSLAGAGIVLALAFYLLPRHGEAPWRPLWQHLRMAGGLEDARLRLGAITLTVVEMWPGVVAVAGWFYVQKQRTGRRVFPLLAVLGFPLVWSMLAFARVARHNPGSALFTALGSGCELVAVVVVASAAFEILAQIPVCAEAWSERDRRAWRMTARGCALVFTLLSGTALWLARPPAKGVRWELGTSTAAGDTLFGKHVLAWSRARWTWDQTVRQASGARALVTMRERGTRAVHAAGEVDPHLARALEQMMEVGQDLGASSRRWYRTVARVNEASREARLPYYLDPETRIRKTKDGLRRRFGLDAFRIVRARRFDVDGEVYATLHVRSLATRIASHRFGLLGLSRDVQPFALVAVDANAHHHDQLVAMGGDGESTARCGRAFEAEADAALERCGERLRAWLEDPAVVEQLASQVERHELQHQIDGPILPLAGEVRDALAGFTKRARARVNRELSAYLAQLTAAETPPGLGLVMPLRFALLDQRGLYHRAAVLLFEVLGSTRVRDGRGRVDTARLSRVYEQLLRHDDEGLAALASDRWAATFHRDLPVVSLLDESVSERGPTSSQ